MKSNSLWIASNNSQVQRVRQQRKGRCLNYKTKGSKHRVMQARWERSAWTWGSHTSNIRPASYSTCVGNNVVSSLSLDYLFLDIGSDNDQLSEASAEKEKE